MNYSELPLSEKMQATLANMGFAEATPIQAKAIPEALKGRDIIGQAQTGTGKTAGFSIPIIEQMTDDKIVQTLILVPTRELALQVSEAFEKLAVHTDFRVATVFGGTPIDRQIRQLRQGFEVVVGTPGRVIDLIKRKVLKLDQLSFLVLDEVDEMLSMGFVDDIDLVVSKITSDHVQTQFFSATMNAKIQGIAQKYAKDPAYIKVKPSKENLKQIDQQYLVMRDGQKQQVLANLLRTQQPEKALVFAKTKKRVDDVTDFLVQQGFAVDRIHGDLSQEQRTFTFKKFRSGLTSLLVATDVAARGLDIKELSHVYNFDLPQETEYYVHRIGRTGRADASGKAVSFFTPKELRMDLKRLEQITGSTMTKITHPTKDEVLAAVAKQAEIQLIENAATIDDKYILAAQKLLSNNDAEKLVASALELLAPEFDEETFNQLQEKDTREPREERGGDRRGGGRGGRGGRDGGRRRDGGGNRGGGNYGGGNRGGGNRGGGNRGGGNYGGGRRRDGEGRRNDGEGRGRDGDNRRRDGEGRGRDGDNRRREGEGGYRGGGEGRRRNDNRGRRDDRRRDDRNTQGDSKDYSQKNKRKKKKTDNRTSNK